MCLSVQGAETVLRTQRPGYPVAELVGIEGGVVSGVFNLESSGVGAPDWTPRHEDTQLPCQEGRWHTYPARHEV
jgi:hypothetical protein